MTIMNRTGIISIDLLERAEKSDSFPKDWKTEKRRDALRRYEQFLLLAKKHPGTALAPTRDIDEMWHLHMLSPCAYFDDCEALFGDLLDHDGGFGKDPTETPALIAAFDETARLWQQEYGEPYVVGVPDEGESRRDAGALMRDCWHDCQSRCWHACSKRAPRRRPATQEVRP
jgi:hypothetical protein